ncbi:hypothetical protein PVAND_017660 [Polypedilum vanderplanki]|uniref:Uncharacterized protein n=1 Tax=Polypedilum vanderplanki TaxID=319348 RepID=A0A9J6B986_POLVA|nr:hypothetical protein PVAND_017660 [Polypedilum vanderplanki]
MDHSLAKKEVIKKDPFMKMVANKADFWVKYFIGSDFEYVAERVRPAYLKELEKFHHSDSFKQNMAQAAKTAYDQFAEDIKSKGTAALKKGGTMSFNKAETLKNVKNFGTDKTGDLNLDKSMFNSGTDKIEDQNLNKTVSNTGTINYSQDFENPNASSTQILEESGDLDLTFEDMESMESEALKILEKKSSVPLKSIKTEKPEKSNEPPKKIHKKT